MYAKGYSLIQLLVTLAVLMVTTTVAIPSFSHFMMKLRVDREISRLHRMLLLTKNHAINSGHMVTICPLNSVQSCSNDWHKTLSIFTDNNRNKIFEPDSGEYLVHTKPQIHNQDKLQYARSRTALIYAPSGHLAIWGGNATFKYCTQDSQLNRGIVISRAGRIYQTQPHPTRGVDVNRSGREISCY